MGDRKNSNYVPSTLNEVLKKIKRNHKVKMYNSDFSYNRMNKGYKQLDFTKPYFTPSELTDKLNDEYYKTWRIILRQRELKRIQRSRVVSDIVYLKDNVEALCLLKEIGGLLEQQFHLKNKGPKVKFKKCPNKKFYFDSKYMGKIFLFSYPKTKEWKAELLTQFLKTKEYLFDEDSPYWKGLHNLKYFCLRFLMNAKVERWEHQVQKYIAQKQ